VSVVNFLNHGTVTNIQTCVTAYTQKCR